MHSLVIIFRQSAHMLNPVFYFSFMPYIIKVWIIQIVWNFHSNIWVALINMNWLMNDLYIYNIL